MPCLNSHYVLSAHLPAAALQTLCPPWASDKSRLLSWGAEHMALWGAHSVIQDTVTLPWVGVVDIHPSTEHKSQLRHRTEIPTRQGQVHTHGVTLLCLPGHVARRRSEGQHAPGRQAQGAESPAKRSVPKANGTGALLWLQPAPVPLHFDAKWHSSMCVLAAQEGKTERRTQEGACLAGQRQLY